MNNGTLELELPQVESDIAEAFSDNIAAVLADVAAGKLDTDSYRDLDDGTYSGEIIGCRVMSQKKDGEARFPKVMFRVRTADFTTSIPFDIDARPNMAWKLKGLLGTFVKLLGPREFAAIQQAPTGLTGAEAFEQQVSYFARLADAINQAGPAVKLTIRHRNGEYNNVDTFLSRRAVA